jgi:hypothetical protein
MVNALVVNAPRSMLILTANHSCTSIDHLNNCANPAFKCLLMRRLLRGTRLACERRTKGCSLCTLHGRVNAVFKCLAVNAPSSMLNIDH